MQLHNARIGIWGFGIVGKSYLTYTQQYTQNIEICDTKKITTQPYPCITQDNTTAFKKFLKNNDYILVSPGIQHHHLVPPCKKITELTLWPDIYHGTTYAITGSAGKTTITTILSTILGIPCAGNIGKPMLDVARQQPQPPVIALELSSFQLQHNKQFSPDLAIWSNFYPNHLDHHSSEQDYFAAKCKLIKHQSPHQKAILPYSLIDRLPPLRQNVSWVCSAQPAYPSSNLQDHHTLVYPNATHVICKTKHSTKPLCKRSQLPKDTLEENSLLILASLQSLGQPTDLFLQKESTHLEHRMERIANDPEKTWINDSKSSIWQATLQAVQRTDTTKPCALLVGGISKGADRSNLFALLPQHITIITFGSESQKLAAYATNHGFSPYSFPTLQKATSYACQLQGPWTILLSPGGASFDEFRNYKERGIYFKKLVTNHISMVEKNKNSQGTANHA